MGFASWQRYCTVLEQWASAKLCGVEQRAPPIFGRAAITLGIGPHSSYHYHYSRTSSPRSTSGSRSSHIATMCINSGTNQTDEYGRFFAGGSDLSPSNSCIEFHTELPLFVVFNAKLSEPHVKLNSTSSEINKQLEQIQGVQKKVPLRFCP